MFLQDKDRMEFQNPPPKFARSANHDTESCGREYWMMRKKEEGEDAGLSLGLELGLGQNSSGSNSKSGGFTFLQMQELHHQSLIYKYIEAGLPVPLHLLVPIWKSFAGLSHSHRFPSFIGGNPLMYLEYGKSLDPEPGRCRRTDGKKWRCSKEAVSNHKYCERHMHRGRQQRSRKLVEPPAHASNSNSTQCITIESATAPSPTTRSRFNMDVASHSNTNLSMSINNNVSPSTFVFSAAEKNESSLCF